MRLNSETNNFKSNRILGLEYSFLKKEKLEHKMVRVIQKREIKEYESTPNFKRINLAIWSHWAQFRNDLLPGQRVDGACYHEGDGEDKL